MFVSLTARPQQSIYVERPIGCKLLFSGVAREERDPLSYDSVAGGTGS